MNPFPKSAWATADRVLSRLSLEQCLAQLLCPDVTAWKTGDLRALHDEIPFGSMFIGPNTAARWAELTTSVQTGTGVPVLVASDFEHGAGCCMPETATDFPWAMAVAAANDPELTRVMGEASDREGCTQGAQWNFAPMIDLALDYNNPVVNIRAMSDRSGTVISHLKPWISGIQARSRMAACAKVFPGDGADDRDQHLCTTVNPLPIDKWMCTYGRIWKKAIDSGVMSIMMGHVSLPAFERIGRDHAKALPATLSHRIQVDLLRRKLGFEGVIVSDAISMGGITSRVPSDQIAVENLRTGGDVVLFPNVRRDFAALQKAVASGRLKERDIMEKTRRFLAMKATLGLFGSAVEKPLLAAERKRFRSAAKVMAEKSLTLFRGDAILPSKLPRGSKVLTVTIGYDSRPAGLNSKLPFIDEELRSRGLTVDHLDNPGSDKLRELAPQYSRIFVNVSVVVHSLLGTVRLVAPICFNFWTSFWMDHPGKAVFTAFGSPWLAYEQPHLPNLLFAYGNNEATQRAAVRVWLGEIRCTGACPVKLPCAP